MSDLRIESHGSVALLFAESEAGQAWLDENVQVESWQMYAGGIACEPRMLLPLVEGAVEDGLEVTS